MRRAAACCLLSVLGLLGCRGETPPPADVVAVIGGERFVYADFDRFLAEQAGEEAAAMPSRVLSRLFDQFLEEHLLRRLAIDEGWVSKGSPPALVQVALLATARLEAVSETEIEDYYRAHRASYVRPERVRLRQILVADRETAQQAAAALANGEPFEQVAARLSTDPAAELGGEQGELARAELPSSFADLVFELGDGETSEIVSAPYGFHIFQVVARLRSEVLGVERVSEAIRDELVRQRGDRVLASRLEQARRRYQVEILTHNLPFDYQS